MKSNLMNLKKLIMDIVKLFLKTGEFGIPCSKLGKYSPRLVFQAHKATLINVDKDLIVVVYIDKEPILQFVRSQIMTTLVYFNLFK